MEPIDAKFYFRKRYVVGIFLFLGVMITAVMKVDINLILVDLTHPKSVLEENETVVQKPAEINWNSKEIGFILGVVTYGLIPALFAAAILARKFGGATIFGLGLFIQAISCLLMPAFLLKNFWLFSVLRIVQGIGEGLVTGSLTEICLHWAPIDEQVRLIMTGQTGSMLGFILSYNISSYILYFFDWTAVFYATGGVGLLLAIMFATLIRNRPADDRFMTKFEREYLGTVINQHLVNNAKLSIFSYPWKKMFSCKPFWAYSNEFFCAGMVGSFVLYCLPLYVKDVTNTDTRNVALMSSIPILSTFISELVFSYVIDCVRSSQRVDKTKVYKIIISFCHFGVALCLTAMVVWSTFEINLILLSIIRILLGAKFVCYHVMPIDAFSQYATITKNFAHCSNLSTNILSPLLMGFIVTNHESSQWNLYFGLLIIFNIFSICVFCRYGSAELQPWAAPPEKAENGRSDRKD